VLRSISPSVHAVAITPADSLSASLVSPRELRPSLHSGQVGSALSFSRPAQRSLLVTACTFARSPVVTLYTRGFSSFVSSTAALIATGWSDSCRVGFAPIENRRLSRRTGVGGLHCANVSGMSVGRDLRERHSALIRVHRSIHSSHAVTARPVCF
jgi:hypothetical protein